MKLFYGQATRPTTRNLVIRQLLRKRIIFDIMLIGAIFYAPWWVVIIFAPIGAFLWPLYYEIIAFGILMDVLYGARSLPFGGIFGIVIAFIIFVTASYAKRVVR